MTGKNVLVVGGSSIPAVCGAVSRRGMKIIGVSFPESVERAVCDPTVIRFEPVNFAHVAPTVRRLHELHDELGFEGIVAISEYGLLAAAMVARKLGMPGTPLSVVQNTRDKTRMRRALEAKGLGQVRFRACATLAEAHEFFAGLDGSMIVKPVMGTGSDGVSRVDTAGQLAQSWRLAGGARAFGGVLCEEFIDGPEVSIEAYLVDGQFVPVAITDKMTDANFLEIGHSQPTLLSASMQERIFSATGEILLALGITSGVTHTEMRLSSKGPVLIETHTRMGGDHINVLTEETTGVDFGEIHVALALGEKPTAPAARPPALVGIALGTYGSSEANVLSTEQTPKAGAAVPAVRPPALVGIALGTYGSSEASELSTAQTPRGGAAIRFVTGREGVVTSVEMPEVNVAAGLHESRCYVKVGNHATGRSASLDRFGHVLAVAATRAEADRIADAAIASVQIVVESPALVTEAVA